MDCPYCGKEMKEGLIPSGDRLQWRDKEFTERVFLSSWAQEAKAFYCPDCRQILLPVPEIEGMWDKVQRKLGAASEKLGAMQEQWTERRGQAAQEKKQRQREQRVQKDPWDM